MLGRVALAATMLAGCGLETDYGGTRYQCREECPEGLFCVDGACRGSPDDGDAGGGGADAALEGYAAAVMADEPILYLRLDETGGDLAMDSSGNERHGTYQVGTTHDADGAVGGAVHCDGVSGRVTVPDDAAVRLNGDWTIEMWVKLDEIVGAYPGVVSKGGADELDTGFIVYYVDESRVLTLKRAGHDGIAIWSEPLSTVDFRHYVVAYDHTASTVTWYVDGTEAEVSPDQAWPENDDPALLSFGRGDEYGKQWLDEIALYDERLSSERVAAHFAAAD